MMASDYARRTSRAGPQRGRKQGTAGLASAGRAQTSRTPDPTLVTGGPFLHGSSQIANALAARLRYIVGTAWSTKCYMNMRPLYQPQLMQTEAVA